MNKRHPQGKQSVEPTLGRFEYGAPNNLEDGIYLVRVTVDDPHAKPSLHVAEYYSDTWMQIGVEYDVWQFHSAYKGALIEVITRFDLDAIEKAARLVE